MSDRIHLSNCAIQLRSPSEARHIATPKHNWAIASNIGTRSPPIRLMIH
ncbi:hypothetical protein [Microseira wollei]|nr:hypothetical protein [Microseira wollei]